MTKRPMIDLADVAAEIGVPIKRLRQLAEKGRFPDIMYADFGKYRIDADTYDAWKASRMVSVIAVRAEITRERVRGGDL